MTSPMSELDRRIGDVLREQPPAPPEMAGRLRRADVQDQLIAQGTYTKEEKEVVAVEGIRSATKWWSPST